MKHSGLRSILALCICLFPLPSQAFDLATEADCFFIYDLDFQLSRDGMANVTQVKWSAQVANKCEQDFRVPIAAGFFSSENRHLVTDIAMADIKAGSAEKVSGTLSEETIQTFERVRDLRVDLNQIVAMEANVTDAFLQQARRALMAGRAVVDAVKDAVGAELEHKVEVLPESVLEEHH